MWHQEDTALFAVPSMVFPSNCSVDRACRVARVMDFWTGEILHLDKIVYFGNLMVRDQGACCDLAKRVVFGLTAFDLHGATIGTQRVRP